MWSRISLRMRITAITAIALSLVTIGITWFANYNARHNIIMHFGNLDNVESGFFETFNRVERGEYFELGQLLNGQESTAEMHFFVHQDNILAMHVFAYQAQSTFMNYSIAVAAIFIVIGTIAVYFLSWQMLKPIKSLAEKMEDVDANNLATAIESPKANDEVSSLTHSFNNMLCKLNRSFETQKLFAQNAAHELKTPLAFMQANIDVLQLNDEPTTQEYKESIDIMKDSTERLIELVEGLLSLNSVTDKMKWQIFSGKDVFESIIHELKYDIAQKDLEVDISGDCDIKGDKTLLERAFFNLVHNAVRYNVRGGLVKINLLESGITIEDSGVGIPAEHLSHIFEPFYCIDKSRSKKLGGNGLGMAITKNIFDKHGMEIRISSEPGQGTKITVSK